MFRYVRKFYKCPKGTTAIEYSLIGGLVAVVIIVGLTNIGESTVVKLQGIANYLG